MNNTRSRAFERARSLTPSASTSASTNTPHDDDGEDREAPDNAGCLSIESYKATVAWLGFKGEPIIGHRTNRKRLLDSLIPSKRCAASVRYGAESDRTKCRS